MAAPVGNQFWKLGAENIGRPVKFSSPEELWQKACDYFDWVDQNPLMSYEWNGKDPVRCELEKMRPYSLTGLYVFLGVNEHYFNQFNEEKNKEFSYIITRIKDVVYTQKFDGAAAGLLNPNIIARDLGLVDKSESKQSHEGELTIKGKKFADSDNNEDKA